MTDPARKPRSSTAKAKVGAEKSAPSQLLELEYSLAELPSAQHRAGLAGLVMMVRWLERAPAGKGTCKITCIDEAGAALVFDRDGLRRLFDETYAASKEEVPQKQLWKKDNQVLPPVRTEEIEVPAGKGKIRKEKVYYYEKVVPKAALLESVEPPTADGKALWVKLWRDMLWDTLRGRDATRAPFKERADKSPSADWQEAWEELRGAPDRATDLPSTYYVGAQATTAENVPFKDRTRQRFLLHFWPYAAQIYVPQITNASEGKTDFVGYALAVPDVAELKTFCEELPVVLRGREVAVAAHRPKGAIIDHPAESALDLARRLRERIRVAEGERGTRDLVLGFDVFHLKKEGNNVRILSVARIEPDDQTINAYSYLKGLRLWDLTFRRRRLVNLLDGQPWYAGFDRLIATLSQAKITIGSPAFCHDARVSFAKKKEESEALMSEGDGQQGEPPTLENVLYALMQSYAHQKVYLKYGLKLDEATKKDPNKTREFNEKKQKVARDAFLAVRSRTGADFVAYFAGTLCSVPHFIPKDRYDVLTQALRSAEESEKVRTLTLLALSAASWVPSAPERNDRHGASEN